MRPLPLLAILLASPAVAETSLHVGASIVSSYNLGYVSEYPGARVEVEHKGSAFAFRARGAAYQSEKLETGDGTGFRVEALAGWHNGHWSALAGIAYRRQSTSAWMKQGTPFLAEVHAWNRYVEAIVGGEYLSDSDDTQTVLSAEVRSRSRFPVFLRFEHVDYRTLFSEGTGSRLEVGVLWRVGK